ncbi:unnamed protein product [Prunus brigantina]
MRSARREKPRISQEHTPIHVGLVKKEKPTRREKSIPQPIWDWPEERKAYPNPYGIRQERETKYGTHRIGKSLEAHPNPYGIGQEKENSVHENSHLEISHASCGSNMHKLAIGQWESHSWA